MGVGALSPEDPADVVTTWADDAERVARQLEMSHDLIGVVIELGADAGALLTPPPAHRPTVARSAGRWIGGLLGSGAAERREAADRRRSEHAVAAAIATLLPRRTSESP